ncbi:MAG: DUF3090 family protein [Anaerolineae bacterium]|nr:DUF3090 family protein [Anaerolineae bacterium]
MPDEIELDAVDFITVGTIGPKGKRIFHLQAGQNDRIVSLILEKQQAQSLARAIQELLEEISERIGLPGPKPVKLDMELREPIEPYFRIAQMGLGYDQARDMIVLIVQELVASEEEEEASLDAIDPQVVRFWGSREQMLALAEHAAKVIRQGRADPHQNGRVVYYWL